MEYYNEDQLYKYFKETIKTESTKKMDRIRKEIDSIKERELNRIDLEVKRQIDWTIGQELVDIKKEHQTKLNQITIENDVKLMAHRTELLKSIFDTVKKKLDDFVKSSKYDKYILDRIDKIRCNSFIIGNSDQKALDIILKINKNAKIAKSKDIKIGGFIAVLGDGKEIDETFDSKLHDKIDDFITESRLFIKK